MARDVVASPGPTISFCFFLLCRESNMDQAIKNISKIKCSF